MNNGKFEEKIRQFRSHIGMYVVNQDYDTVTAFICGLDYATDGVMLKGFEKWLLVKYNLRYSQLWWPALLKLVHENLFSSENGDSIGFALNNVIEFVSAQSVNNMEEYAI